MRAELLGQVVGAQFELERALAEMPVAARVEGTQQLAGLRDLQRQIGSANPAMLHALRADIATAVAVARAAVGQGRDVATTPEGIAMLAEAATASHEQVRAAMENMHRYDAFLQFGPGDCEADYRQREAERRRYIDAEQAKHTPSGDLNAAGGAMGQMVDAKAHGAGDSPEFKAQWDALVATTEKLRDAAQANGVSTEEFDRHLRDDLRRIMKAKGLSDAQISARFAAQPDPLEAAKAYVENEQDASEISRAAKSAARLDTAPSSAVTVAPLEDHGMGNAIAKLQMAGATAAEPAHSDAFAHGVTAGTTVNMRTVQV